MWMVDPRVMCNKHLLGEHSEIHMFIGVLKRKKKIDGYIKNNLLEISSILIRHQRIVEEMISRGIRHNSPLDFDVNIYDYLPQEYKDYKIDRIKSLKEIRSRCHDCSKKIAEILIQIKETRSICQRTSML